MLRHTALFMWRDTTTEQQKLIAKKGLAYMSYGCPSVRHLDFGSDLLGGSSPLLEIEPWKRTPLWHARHSGPPCDFDMALHLDFDDQDGMDRYNKDPVHHEVGEYNVSVCRPEQTARVDWWYEGGPRIEKGLIRSTSLFLWTDEATDLQKADVRDAFRALNGAVPSLRSLVTGDNTGTLTTDYDLIVDAHFAELADAEAYGQHPACREALALAVAATKYEWTARITHRMASG
jgi:hypothetical protein